MPAEVVWRKIITSAYTLSPDVLPQGAGYARWTVNEQRDPAGAGSLLGGLPVNGLADVPKGYRLDWGQCGVRRQFRAGLFRLELELATNRAWEQLALRLYLGKSSLAIRSLAVEQNVRLLTDEDGEGWSAC